MTKIGKDRILELTGRIDTNSSQIKEISNMLLKPYVDSIDAFMTGVLDRVRDKNNPPDIDELNSFILQIPSELYFTSEGVISLSIKEDVAKAIRNELYNEAHLEARGTVDTKKSIAELEVLEETIIQSAYTRANQQLKLKIELATEVLNSCKASFKRELIKMEIARGENARR
jgi:hypothetical protein